MRFGLTDDVKPWIGRKMDGDGSGDLETFSCITVSRTVRLLY